jgi:uroporphyrin-III C-methyltransferase / precorrin-2 dehydrogenase / sirohydrochlorin ferrochelatase
VIIDPPPAATPTRMAALSRLPAFFSLEGKRAVVAEGTAAAAWKAELLSAAGAQVEVLAPKPSEEMRALAGMPPRGPIVVQERGWEAADFAGAAIAVADCADDAAAAEFAAAARHAGVPVNVVDRPAFSDFAFGAIVNRSPLVIGISTDGAAPVFAQAIRAKIETLIPKGFSLWAEAARAWRPRVRALAMSFRDRHSFWERFAVRAIAAPDVAPTDADLDALLTPSPEREAGSVIVVGAGPGDPELLTLRAVRMLQSADVILFDGCVAADILDFARREAKKMLVGEAWDASNGSRHDVDALTVALAKAGRRVVRLMGGDPMVSGRGNSAMQACRAAGIVVDVVPGIAAMGDGSEDFCERAAKAETSAPEQRKNAPHDTAHR